MQKTHPQLVVMLTHNDHTVENAAEIFAQCKNSKARIWGFKEKPLPLEDMKTLYAAMKASGKMTALEVVCYNEEEGLAGARMAAECGCDLLMGTVYSDAINAFCQAHQLKYMPFVGEIKGRPSVLSGSIAAMIEEAQSYLEKGVYGIDLLGYRYDGDAAALNRAFIEAVDAPVCLAGSINDWQRLNEVKESAPWSFTIGGAFFEHKFGDDICQQINAVCDYMCQNDEGKGGKGCNDEDKSINEKSLSV